MNRRATGSSSRAGVPGGRSSYATSEKPMRPTGRPAAAILRRALTISRYELPVMLYEKSITTTLVPFAGRYDASVTPPPRATLSSSAAAPAIASARTRRATVVARIAGREELGSGHGTAAPECLRGIRTATPGRSPHACAELARLVGRGRRRRPRKRARLVAELNASAALQLERDELERA